MTAYKPFDPTPYLQNQSQAEPGERAQPTVATFTTCARPAPVPTADEWRKVYAAQCDRVMLRRGVTLAQAVSVAWERTVSLWHSRHGAQPPASTCAACGRFSPDTIQALPDGALVCDDDCLRDYGRRWQAAADEALRSLGVEPIAAIGTQTETLPEPHAAEDLGEDG
jgi:hypothetical protein